MGKLCFGVLCWCLAASLSWAGEAEELFKKGRRAAQQGDAVTAFLYFSRARAADPTDSRFTRAVTAVRAGAGQTLAALGSYQAAAAIDAAQSYLLQGASETADEDPADVASLVELRAMRAQRRLMPPVELRPSKKNSSFRLNESVGETYEAVAREFGLKVIFDSDFDREKEVGFELDEVDFTEAVRVLNDVARAIVVPVTPEVFLVAEDSASKRTELEPMATAIIPVPDAMTDEEVQQMGQAVQQVLEVKRLQTDRANRQVVLRDTVHRVRLAREIYRQLSQARGEVVLEVDLIAMNETEQVDFGVKLPTAFPLTNFSTVWRNQPPDGSSGVPLLGIGAGQTVFGVAIADALLTAKRTRSSGRSLQRFQLRSAHGQPATLNIGERFPIINARFSAVVINQQIRDETQAGTLRQPFPSFTFEDLGLNFTATTNVHDANEVSIEFELEVQLLSGSAVNDIPILSNRSFNSAIRLRTDQTAVITGMKIFERRKNRSGPAWLSQIPWLGRLFSDQSNQFNVSELIVTLRPRIVRLPPAEIEPSLALRYGPETRPLSAL